MSTRRYVYAFALAGMLASILPGASYGGAPAPQEVQLFPPGTPGTTMTNIAGNLCGPLPAGSQYTYALVWDGTDPVWCSQVPINCPAGDGLVFDGHNFQCVVPCEPTAITVGGGSCPAGEVGSPGGQYELQYCDGTTSAPFGTAPNTCGTPIPAVSAITCTPGSTVPGSYITIDGNQVLDPGAGGSVICP